MVKFYTTLAVLCISLGINAQCFVQLQCNPTSCSGSCDGSATAFANGVPPFTYMWSVPSATGSTVTGLCAGSIMVVVTDSLGCQATASCVITSPAPLQAMVQNVVNPSCAVCCDGSMSASASGGTGPYTYTWAGPNGFTSTQPAISNLCGGTYTLCVTDANGCVSCTTVMITGPAPNCSVQLQCTNVSCFGGCDGAATAYPNGVPPFNYIWTVSLSTAQTVTGLCAGQVQVTMLDSLGCQATATCTISQPPQLNALIINPVNPSCPTCCDGSLTASASGGVPAYTYTWSGPNGFTSNQTVISNLCGGTYSLCVTDMNGCVSCQTFTIIGPMQVDEHSDVNSMNVTQNSPGTFLVNAGFSAATSGEILVTNSLGQIIFRKQFSDQSLLQHEIDLRAEAAGVYSVTVVTANGSTSQRIVNP